MNKPLIFLLLIVAVLCWKFVFTSSTVEYTDQAKILQGISMAISYKSRVRQYWQETGSFPSSDNWAELKDKPKVDISKSLVESINVGEAGPGTITIYFTNKPANPIDAELTDTRVILLPASENQRVIWACKSDIPLHVLPDKCNSMLNKVGDKN